MPYIIHGQAGETDDSFGDHGIIIEDIEGQVDYCGDIAIKNDGTIFITGRTYNNATESYDVFIVCHNANGSLNNSFGENGLVIASLNDLDPYPNSVEILPNEDLLVSGSVSSNLFIMKFNEFGNPDSTFGSDGRVITSIADTVPCGGGYLAVQIDGKLILSGHCIRNSNYNLLLIRYNLNGAIDPGFGKEGIVETDLGGWEAGTSVAILDDNKIVLSGYTTYDENNDFILLRFNPNGTLDNLFGNNGLVQTDLTGKGSCDAVLIQSDDKILQGGTFNKDFVLVRYTPEGKNDLEFGNQGVVMTDLYNENARVHDITIQPDGKILVVGDGIWFEDHGYLILDRYNSDGSLDSDFGVNGRVEWESEAYVWVYGQTIALQPDNKIIVSGDCSFNDFLLFRFLPGSISGNSEKSEFNLDVICYPNPASNQLTVELLNLRPGIYTLDMFDITGKIVFSEQLTISQNIKKTILDLTGYSEGLYLLKLSGETFSQCERLMIN